MAIVSPRRRDSPHPSLAATTDGAVALAVSGGDSDRGRARFRRRRGTGSASVACAALRPAATSSRGRGARFAHGLAHAAAAPAPRPAVDPASRPLRHPRRLRRPPQMGTPITPWAREGLFGRAGYEDEDEDESAVTELGLSVPRIVTYASSLLRPRTPSHGAQVVILSCACFSPPLWGGGARNSRLGLFFLILRHAGACNMQGMDIVTTTRFYSDRLVFLLSHCYIPTLHTDLLNMHIHRYDHTHVLGSCSRWHRNVSYSLASRRLNGSRSESECVPRYLGEPRGNCQVA
jgi:hypothetical protein